MKTDNHSKITFLSCDNKNTFHSFKLKNYRRKYFNRESRESI